MISQPSAQPRSSEPISPPDYSAKIELVDVRRLVPYENNARVHTRRQIKEIARSMERFGLTNPILLDRNRRIIAGHGRWLAAKLLGMTKVPTIRLDHLTEVEVRAYILADNRLAEKAGWDREILALELQGLIELDFDVGPIGFEMAEIDLLLEEAAQKADDSANDNIAPPCFSGPPVSKTGDLWRLGPHSLLCADARDSEAYRAVLDGKLAELVIADPPYNHLLSGEARASIYVAKRLAASHQQL